MFTTAPRAIAFGDTAVAAATVFGHAMPGGSETGFLKRK